MTKMLKTILILAMLLFTISSNLLGQSLFNNTYEDTYSKKTCEYAKGRFGSFAIRDDKLYLLSGLALYSYDLLSQEQIWEYKVYGESWSRLFLSNESIYFGTSSLAVNKKDSMVALNMKTGEKIWEINYGLYPNGNICIENEVLYFGAQSINAINILTGRTNWFINTYSHILSGPLFSQNLLVFINNHVPLDANIPIIDGRVDIKHIYSYNNKQINVIDINGKPQWKPQPVKDEVFTISNGIILCNKLNKLSAIDLFTGEVKWDREMKENLLTLFTDTNTIYYGTNKGSFVALDLENHQEKWRFKTDGPITSNPVIYNDIIYFTSSKSIYGLDITSGAVKFQFRVQEKPGVSLFGYLTTPVIYANYLYFLDSKGNLGRINIM